MMMMMLSSLCVVVKYQLETYTGYKVDNAGTNANVYVTIVSDSGTTTGKRALKKSLNNAVKFVMGKVIHFLSRIFVLGFVFSEINNIYILYVSDI